MTALLVLSASLPSMAQNVSDYRLGAGDDIRIQVFQNPDLAVETRVPDTGVISYPLIGKVNIGGLSVTAAQKAIADALQQGKFVKNPQVTITLGQIRGSQVSVLGQVNRPGRFPLENYSARPSDMLAAAGGVTPTGDDVAIVIGVRNGKEFRETIDIPGLFITMDPTKQITLQDGDTIYVNRAPVFYIYGEAQRPGPYRIERGMTIMQALAQGGGPTPRGSETRLRLTRKNAKGVVEDITPKLTDPIQSDDVIYVRESLF
ncbi:polysaccharide export protein EpsE [Xylophilus sp. GOD-11R]|uniref:polysaccharide export protein EpsE n=1 Tax=Xylophilus sp. GOD-11R TaxID=3089814 RepID=UPI00298CBC98|nr:polysaccharide export protein EpsE [Xylophilus sp. GOD-11R]WPB57918.1 polysaccharide export protein EpsE [Xylophilus sp. GOD-11R]